MGGTLFVTGPHPKHGHDILDASGELCRLANRLPAQLTTTNMYDRGYEVYPWVRLVAGFLPFIQMVNERVGLIPH